VGSTYGSQSLSLRIREVLRAIGESKYTTHGLRKNAGIYLAENGATVPQIMAALGHKMPKMALYYWRLANQALLADQVTDILDKADAKHMRRRGSPTVAQGCGWCDGENTTRTDDPGNCVRYQLSARKHKTAVYWQHCDMNASVRDKRTQALSAHRLPE
jgi:hypothetical protein